MKFSDQVAVVTGASRGIGFHIAKSLALQGAQVIITGRDNAALQAGAEEIQELGGNVIATATAIWCVLQKYLYFPSSL